MAHTISAAAGTANLALARPAPDNIFDKLKEACILGIPRAAIDHQIFRRAASLFAQKRRALDADTARLLAGDIVRRLSRRVICRDASLGLVSAANVDAFCDTLLHDDPDGALQFVEDRRAEGLTRQDISLGYIGAAAVRLGERWDDDLLSFIDVSVATGHLYALMRSLRDEVPERPVASDARKRALFATVPGEDHGIGITMAADLFREAGWQIDLQIGGTHDSLAAHAEQTMPPVIGFSMSTDKRLGELMRLVVAVRVTLPDALIGVAPAAGIDPDRLRNLVDIDLVFDDAPSALAELDRMIRNRA